MELENIVCLLTKISNGDKLSIFKKKPKLNISAVCNQGLVRDNNEDNFVLDSFYLPLIHSGCDIVSKQIGLSKPISFGVFDGMGGEKAGELASYTACKSFVKRVDNKELDEKKLQALFVDINKEVYDKSVEEKISQIGTTGSVMIVNKDEAYIVNVGDSPIFRFRDNELELLSNPHTNEQWLKDNDIKQKAVLTQFIGLDYSDMLIEPYVKKVDLKNDDLILICSDGLTDMVDEKKIKEMLSKKDTTKEKVQKLLDTALDNGGKDNVTIIIGSVEQ